MSNKFRSFIIENLILKSDASIPQQRPFCVVGRLVRKKKRELGARWEAEKEKRD